MPLEKDKIGLILLGASEFPRSGHYNGSEAFLNAKKRIRNYFETRFSLQEPQDILDLFDKDYEPNKIDGEIDIFIKERHSKIKDLIIYYVGHGGHDNNNGFLLTIRQSRDSNLAVSSITAQNLGKTLSRAGSQLRLFLILDCCFAGDLFTKFQSPFIDVVQRDIANNFPDNGIALLCSSSKDKPSVIVKNGKITMFSEALDTTLRKGSPQIKSEYLTLRDVGNLTFSYIKAYNPGEAVRPEVHTPLMPQGDIADIPGFPNHGFKPDGFSIAYNIYERGKEIDDNIIANNLENAAKLLLSFIGDFDELKKYSIDGTLTAAASNSLETHRPSTKERQAYEKYNKDRQAIYRKILEIKFDIIRYHETKIIK